MGWGWTISSLGGGGWKILNVQGLKEAKKLRFVLIQQPYYFVVVVVCLFVFCFSLALRTIISGDLQFAFWLSYPSPVDFCVTA